MTWPERLDVGPSNLPAARASASAHSKSSLSIYLCRSERCDDKQPRAVPTAPATRQVGPSNLSNLKNPSVSAQEIPVNDRYQLERLVPIGRNVSGAPTRAVTPQERRFVQRLYGSNPTYTEALIDYVTTRAWTIACHVPLAPWCLQRLAEPGHRCNGRCFQTTRRDHGAWLDHSVWLRRGPGRRPDQWALLSQPYDVDRDDLDATVSALGAAWEITGAAPYGFDTVAVLVEGVTRDPEVTP